MSAFGRARNWFRAIFARRNAEREMREEMAAHIAQAAERFVASGMSEKDALSAAMREFGNVSAVQESARDARGGRWVESVIGDVRYALRHFVRRPLMSITIVVTLMIGIGANAALFAILHGVLARPAAGVKDDPSLVFIQGTARQKFGDGRLRLVSRGLSYREVDDYRALPGFKEVAAWRATDAAVVIGEGNTSSVSASVQFVTPNYFKVAGLTLAAGAGFLNTSSDANESAELSVIIEYGMWQEYFGGQPSAIGSRIRVNGAIVTVVGVAPKYFIGVEHLSHTPYVGRTVWMPRSASRAIEGAAADDRVGYESGGIHAFARVADGANLKTVAASVAVVAARSVAQMRRTEGIINASSRVLPISSSTTLDGFNTNEDLIVGVMLATVGTLILLACCTNVGSLLIGSAVARRLEIAVRLSMGASRMRIVRQLFTEALLLACLGGTLGLTAYWLIIKKIDLLAPGVDVAPDLSGVAITGTIAVIAAIVCGLSPALHATRIDLSSVLKDSTATATGRTRLQRTMVVAQIALTQPLLVGLAMTLAAEFATINQASGLALGDRLLRLDFGFAFSSRGFDADKEVFRRVRERLEAVPGVAGVAIPIGGETRRGHLVAALGQRTDSMLPMRVQIEGVDPRVFAMHGIAMQRGREFDVNDSRAAVVPLVVSSAYASFMWGKANPLGQRLLSDNKQSPGTYEVVGVVDSKGLDDPARRGALRVFAPTTTDMGIGMGRLVVRTTAPAEVLIPTIQAIAREEAPLAPLRSIKTVAQRERENQREALQAMAATAAFAALALLLAAIGLYAMIALAVQKRRREIGLRIALGASPAKVVALFFRRGVRLVAIGLAIGLPPSLAGLVVWLRLDRTPGVSVVGIGSVVALGVLIIASVATWLPARRAAGVDPIDALKVS